MSGPASSRSPRPRTGSGWAARRRERGGISWVSLLLLVLVTGGAYLARVWIPIYFDHYTVKQVVADYMNQAVKNPDDQQLRRGMIHKIATLDAVRTTNDAGVPVTVPAIQLDEREVVWERDVAARSLHISFEYQRDVVYPFLGRTTVATFVVDTTGDLTLPDWGPAR